MEVYINKELPQKRVQQILFHFKFCHGIRVIVIFLSSFVLVILVFDCDNPFPTGGKKRKKK